MGLFRGNGAPSHLMHRSSFAGVVAGVHRIGDDYAELAGQNDWFAGRFSAHGRKRPRRWGHPDHGQRGDTGLFVGGTHTGDTPFPRENSWIAGLGDQRSFGRLLFRPGAFERREGGSDRYIATMRTLDAV